MSKGHTKVSVLARGADFPDCEDEWDDLLARSGFHTVFRSHDWARIWWRHYRGDAELYILRADRDGHLVGIAPMYRRRTKGLLPVREVRFLGDGSFDSDYLGFIIPEGSEKEVVGAFLSYLESDHGGWDRIVLNEIPAEDPIFSSILGHLESTPCYFQLFNNCGVRNRLPDTWEDFLKKVRPRYRTKIRSLVRNLEKEHRLRFSICETPEELEWRLPSLFDLHTRRWNRENRPGVFREAVKREFYRDISRRCLETGRLRLYTLEANDVPVAHQFCFLHDGTLSLLQEGYDPDYLRYEPGNVLRSMVFQDAIRARIPTYDFLGGVTFHKLSWGGEVTHSRRIEVGRRDIKGMFLIAAPATGRNLKERIRNVLPPGWLDRMQRIRRRFASGRNPAVVASGTGNEASPR